MTNQIVILCGGMGKRLLPITKATPKPLARVNGIPFIRYLANQVKEQGFDEILLLTGYLGELIAEYFSANPVSGVKIKCIQGPVEWETGKRLWNAKNSLQESFILMYADNFANCCLNKMIAKRTESNTTICMLIQPKLPGNIDIDGCGIVNKYDNNRSESKKFVEVGYMSVDRIKLLKEIETDKCLSKTLEKLSRLGELSAIEGSGSYHSISDIDRLKLTEKFLRHKKIILIDRDGTINKSPGKGNYVTSWDEFIWEDKTIQAMGTLSEHGFVFIIISNQAGIARGLVSQNMVDQINKKMTKYLRSIGIEILDILYCPHGWDDNCKCRKPKTGLFYEASKKYNFRLDNVVYVGDDTRDVEAAYNAGCKSVFLSTSNNVSHKHQPDKTCANLINGASYILRKYETWEKEAKC